MKKDIVVDTTVIRLYGVASDPIFRDFFSWLFKKGVLACSQMLLTEYGRTRSNTVASLIDHLVIQGRFRKYDRQKISAVNDRHFTYTCNHADRCHVQLVMCTYRRFCLSQDGDLVNDVNRFPRFKASAATRPDHLNYK